MDCFFCCMNTLLRLHKMGSRHCGRFTIEISLGLDRHTWQLVTKVGLPGASRPVSGARLFGSEV